MCNRCYCFLLLLVIAFGVCSKGYGQMGYTLSEPLTSSSGGQLVLHRSQLTGDGGIDPVGGGWLRLTTAGVTNQGGYAIVNQSFPAILGIELDFEFAVWGGNGADGFSIFLFDAEYDPMLAIGDPRAFKIGGMGGSLGYANRSTEAGLSGGYIGVGIDEWGNYAVSSEGKNGGASTQRSAQTVGIGVRGGATAGYPWLGGVGNLETIFGQGFALDFKGPNLSVRPSSDIYFRHVYLVLDPVFENGGITYELTVKLQTEASSVPVVVVDKLKIDQVPPDFMKIGFAAATGGNTNFHEVRKLHVSTPGDVWVSKSVNRSEARVGDELVYTIKMMNQFAGHFDHLSLRDTLPENFRVTSIIFDNRGHAGTAITDGWTAGSLNLEDVTLNMDALSDAYFVVEGVVTGVPDDNMLTNTARFNVTDLTGYSDNRQENNKSTVSTRIIKPEIVVSDDRFTMPIGTLLTNMYVLANDSVDAGLVDLGLFGIVVRPPAQPVGGASVPVLDVGTGKIILPGTIFVGMYAIEYELYERINPLNFKRGIVHVEILQNALTVDGEDFGLIREGQPVLTASVLDNDRWNEQAIHASVAVFSWDGLPGDGITLEEDGRINVSSQALAGVYVLPYTICDVYEPTNCKSTTVKFEIRNILDVKNDHYSLIMERTGVVTQSSVLDNDLALGLSVTVEDIFLVPGVSSNPNLRMDANGVISVAQGTREGRYTYTYTVCELLRPTNCQQAIAYIEIIAKPLFVPNIITPNSDGFNDFFEIVGYEAYDRMSLVILNNAGQEVFSDVTYINRWSGTGLASGTYFYVLKLERSGNTDLRKGFVTVKRE